MDWEPAHLRSILLPDGRRGGAASSHEASSSSHSAGKIDLEAFMAASQAIGITSCAAAATGDARDRLAREARRAGIGLFFVYDRDIDVLAPPRDRTVVLRVSSTPGRSRTSAEAVDALEAGRTLREELAARPKHVLRKVANAVGVRDSNPTPESVESAVALSWRSRTAKGRSAQ